MLFWLFGGCYWTWETANPHKIGNTIIPWLCVLILGLIMFGAVPGGIVR
jgi:hypothetical protein